jgi:two-component system nitrogen regulation sensor histidine kinase NtrY
VLLSISDNGGGIPESLLNKITEPYVTSKEKGTGLGLAIVKRIIEEHKGKFSIHNIYDGKELVGAKMDIELPV